MCVWQPAKETDLQDVFKGNVTSDEQDEGNTDEAAVELVNGTAITSSDKYPNRVHKETRRVKGRGGLHGRQLPVENKDQRLSTTHFLYH